MNYENDMTPVNRLTAFDAPLQQAGQTGQNGGYLYASVPAQGPMTAPGYAIMPPKPLNPWLSQKVQLFSVLASMLLARLHVEAFGEFVSWALSNDRQQNNCYPLLFTLVLFAWCEILFRLREKNGAPRPEAAVLRETAFWEGCTLALSLTFVLGRANAAGLWCWIFWHGFGIYAVACRAGLLTERRTGSFFAIDATCAAFAPLVNFFLAVRVLWAGFRSLGRKKNCIKKRWRDIFMHVLPVMAAVPVFCLAASLLGEADAGFALLLADVSRFFSFHWLYDFLSCSETAIWMILVPPISAYIYAVVGGSARRTRPYISAAATRKCGESLRLVPPTASTTVLVAFCLLYAAFFVVQGGYLFGAFYCWIPQGFTVAEYARQGFYRLCIVLMINFSLLIVCVRMNRRPVRQCRAVQIFALVLMVATLLLSITAFSKILLYIQCFSFTPRRLLSLWAVTVFAVASILTACNLLRPFPAIRWLVEFAAASFTVLCLAY